MSAFMVPVPPHASQPGPANGWTPAAAPDFATVIARYLNRRPTALLLDLRDHGPGRGQPGLAGHVTLFRRFEDIDFDKFELLIAVTWRHYTAPVPSLHLWARAVCVGVGCTRGSDPQALASSAEAMLLAEGVAPAAVRVVASARLRQDEPALRDWAAALGAAFVTFDAATLGACGVPNPSDIVASRLGTPSVAEAAALTAAGRADLLIPKRKAALPGGHYHTLAVAVADGPSAAFTGPDAVQTVILTPGKGGTRLPAGHPAALRLHPGALPADDVQRRLRAHYPPETPVAVLHRLTRPDERVSTGILAELAGILPAPVPTGTTLIVAGAALLSGLPPVARARHV